MSIQYDNRANDLTKEGMLKGIEQAAAFILFLSSGVLSRPYCQMEIRHALALKRPIVLVHEVGVARIHTRYIFLPVPSGPSAISTECYFLLILQISLFLAKLERRPLWIF